MLEKVKNTIKKSNMLQKTDKILVGLSGGADSVCLCCVLKELGYTISAAHVNHKIRTQAEQDMNFVKEFCNEKGITLHILEEDVKTLAKK